MRLNAELPKLKVPEPFYGLGFDAILRAIPRSTVTSGKKVPLAHVIVGVTDAEEFSDGDLETGAHNAWKRMKQRAVSRIGELYATRDPAKVVELRHALITNANLDLNQPGAPT
jgi:hypothetical protein